jgi:hypothetical protein
LKPKRQFLSLSECITITSIASNISGSFYGL